MERGEPQRVARNPRASCPPHSASNLLHRGRAKDFTSARNMFEAATHCDLVDEMMNWTSRMIGLRAGLWQGSRYTFRRRVHLHCDLEYTLCAGEVQFSVADAQWINGEAWGIAVLGFRLARWGSPALHPRLSKSAVSPLNARCDCHTLDSCQSCQRAWEVKVSDRRLENGRLDDPATRYRFSHLQLPTKEWFVSRLGANRTRFLVGRWR